MIAPFFVDENPVQSEPGDNGTIQKDRRHDQQNPQQRQVPCRLHGPQ